MVTAVQWLLSFAVSTIVVGYICIGAGLVIYSVADIVLALIARHS